MRYLYSPRSGEYNPNVVPVRLGGTGAKTKPDAAKNLGSVSLQSVGKARGPVPLNAQGKATGTLPDGLPVPGHSIFGPTKLVTGASAQYRITDFDKQISYTVSTDSGSVSMDGDIVVYTAPSQTGNFGFNLGIRFFPVRVIAAAPSKPEILSPTENAAVGNNQVVFSSSAFVMTSPTSTDTHAVSDWELSSETPGAFGNISSRVSEDSSTNKRTWTVTGFKPNIPYSVRVRYKGVSTGYGEWSDYRHFTAGA